MKNYFVLVRMLLCQFFKKNPNARKNSPAVYIVLGLSFVLMTALFVVCFVLLGETIGRYNLVPETLAAIFGGVFVFTLFFGTINIVSSVFYEPECEFLVSLPVKPGIIYLAKLTVIYIQESMVSFFMVLSCMLPLGIMTSQGAIYYVMIIAGMFMTPMMTLLFSSLVAIPVMAVSSFFKNKGIISTVILLLFFAAFFVGYLMIEMNMMNAEEENPDKIMESVKEALIIISLVFYPFLCLGRIAAGRAGIVADISLSNLIDLGIYLGTFLILVLLVFALSSYFYERGVLQFGTKGTETVRKKEYSGSSVFNALLKKEWRELSRNTQFAFQCLAGLVITPAFAFMYPFLIFTEGEAAGEGDYLIILLMAFMITGMLSIGMNMAAATAVSREGKNFVYMKMMPVPFELQLKAKKRLCEYIEYGVVILSMLITAVLLPIKAPVNDYISYALSIILSTATLIIANNIAINLDILHDAKKPNLTWTNPKEAVKTNMSLMLPMFAGMGVSILIVIYAVVMYVIFESLNIHILAPVAAFVPLIILGLILSRTTEKALYEKGSEILSELIA